MISRKIPLSGSSYVTLECAELLKAFGNNATVMSKTYILSGFDRAMESLIKEHILHLGII